MGTRMQTQWIATHAYFDGENASGALIHALPSTVFSNRQLGACWTLHVRKADQADGEMPLASIRLSDEERRELIRQLGGIPQ